MENSPPPRSYTLRVWIALGAVMLVVAICALVGWLLTGVLILFAALLFGVFLNQLARRIEQSTGLPYRGGVLLVALTILVGVAATLFFTGSQIVSQVDQLSDELEVAFERLWQRVDRTGVPEMIEQQEQNAQDGGLSRKALSYARRAVLNVVAALGGIVVVAIVGFYLAFDPQKYREGLVRLFPPQHRTRVDDVARKVAHSLWAWTLGRMVAMLLVGTGSTIGLWIIGVPLPVTNGVIAGLLDFVPNVGPFIASIPPILLALQQGGYMVFYVIGLYLALQFAEAYFITPLIDQQQVHLPPGLILAAQLLMGMLGGFLGLMLATPIAAVTFVLVREFYVYDVLEKSPLETPSPKL